jgi:hypothetical protein
MPKTQEPRPVPADALDRIGAWSRRKPRFALMGEFSSGKSTLLNLLIGEDLLPTRVTATELPPVWFSHGAPRAFWVDRQGRQHPLGFGEFAGVPRSARYLRVFTPAPFLQGCDVLDTPGISDPNLEEESWRFPVGQANFVLWCTPATQAWRETERSTWLSLPERLRARSVLVVTRADKLALPTDRDKVARRLARESFGLFGSLVFLSSLDAVRGRQLESETGDGSLWARSGGAELLARIGEGVAGVRADRADLLSRYRAGTAPPRRPVVATVTALPGAMRPLAEAPAEAPAPMRLVDPVRPRRVELPDARRSERPAAEDGPDPLDEIRAGWMALRDGDRAEPATVLRLTDPVRAPDPLPEVPVAPSALVRPEASEREDGALEAMIQRASAPEDAALEAMLRAASEAPAEEPAPESGPESGPEFAPEAGPAPAEAPLPRAVRVWREIVARSPEIPSNGPILAMIDQLLCELSRDDQQAGAIDPALATIIERNQAA